MLSQFSWAEYFTFLALGLAIYYGWWLSRFYPTLRRRGGDQVEGGAAARAGEGKRHVPQTVDTGGEQAHRGPDQALPVNRKVAELPAPPQEQLRAPAPPVETVGAKQGGQPEYEEQEEEERVHLPMLAGEAVEKIKALLDRAQREGLPEPEVVYAFQRLLGEEPYCRLRYSDFYTRINDTIIGLIKNTGSIPFDAERIAGLWVR